MKRFHSKRFNLIRELVRSKVFLAADLSADRKRKRESFQKVAWFKKENLNSRVPFDLIPRTTTPPPAGCLLRWIHRSKYPVDELELLTDWAEKTLDGQGNTKGVGFDHGEGNSTLEPVRTELSYDKGSCLVYRRELSTVETVWKVYLTH